MKKLLPVAVALAALAVVMPPADTAACGDKFLVIGRTTRRVPRAKHPGSILIALPAGSPAMKAARAMKLEATLKRAGHTVETTAAPVSLAALATGSYDVILAGLDVAPAIADDAAGAVTHPVLIPLAVGVDKPARMAAESRYGQVLEAPSRSLAYLGALDEVIARRRAVVAR